MNASSGQEGQTSLPGVIDCLSEGFSIVNRIPWLLLIPIGFTLLIGLLPPVSVARIAQGWLGALIRLVEASPDAQSVDPALWASTLESIKQTVNDPFVTNLLTLSTWNLVGAAAPSISLAGHLRQGGIIEVGNFGALVGLGLLIHLAGLALGLLFLGLIAQRVRDGQIDPGKLASRFPRYFLSSVGFILLLIGFLVGVSIPLGIIVSLAMLISPALANLIYLLVSFGSFFFGVWFLVYLFFLVDAIVLGEMGPIAAIRSSVAVVSRSFVSSLGFITVSIIIGLGMSAVWSALLGQSWGIVLAIFGSAYIASGLAAASLFFYRTRMHLPAPTRRRL